MGRVKGPERIKPEAANGKAYQVLFCGSVDMRALGEVSASYKNCSEWDEADEL